MAGDGAAAASIHRLFGIAKGALLYVHEMAALGHKLSPHLSARLIRVEG